MTMMAILIPMFMDANTFNFSRCRFANSCFVQKNILRTWLFPGDERAEVRDRNEDPFGKEVEFNFALQIPNQSRLETDNQSIVIAQYKAKNDESPPVALRWKGHGEFTVTLRHNGTEEIPYRGPIAQGEWVTFKLRILTGQKGHLLVWQNGTQIVNYEGPLGYEGTPNYFKFGPYDYTRTQKSPLQIIYAGYRRHLKSENK